MKFTLSWLKNYLNTHATAEEISAKLTAIGLEVEEVVDRAKIYAPFKVAHILEASRHPDADKLQVCKVNDGTQTLQIVCGAPNARAGLKVVLAPVGTTIPANNMVIKASKIRGVESNGMLCSASELGLGDDHSGIIELPENLQPGASYATEMGLDDPVFDIAITPNRGDCLGVYGVARDLAAAGLGTLKKREVTKQKGCVPSPVTVTIENTTDCPLFVGRYFKNVKNGESPTWLKAKLEAIGLKPISALVDITNYINYDLGRPLHVYDVKKLQGGLTVKRAKGGEEFAALNNKSYSVPEGTLIIADNTAPQALAGVIGGAASGCEMDTTEVFLEVALFDPKQVANTGRKLSIHTDSRYRFERNVDPAFVYNGAEIATKLILELCGGETSELVVAGKEPSWQRNLNFSLSHVKHLGGIDLPRERCVGILQALGFGVEGNGDTVPISIPSWRPDIEGSADFVEEILRIHGYDAIPYSELPHVPFETLTVRTPKQQAIHAARRALAGNGMTEVITWSFMDSKKSTLFSPVKDELKLLNPISSELDIMRPSLLPNLLDAASRNANRGFEDVAFFEIGAAYRSADPVTGQDNMVAGIRVGKTAPKNIYKNDRNADVFDAKADVLLALEAAGAPVQNLQITTDAPHWYHPGKSGVLRLGKTVLATFGELHPSILKASDVEGAVAAFELFLDTLPPQKQKKTTAKPKLEVSAYQSVTRDFAFIVDTGVQVEALLRAIRKSDKGLIDDVQVFDVYAGKGIEDGKKSVAISVRLQPKDRTLTDEEIEAVATQVVNTVAKETGGALRG